MNFAKRSVRVLACALSLAALGACSSSKDIRRVPTELTDFKSQLSVSKAWETSVGKSGSYLFAPTVVGTSVYAAGANGTVAKIDATNGHDVWRTKVGADLSAGVGSDGTLSAVGGLKGEVFVLGADGKLLWKGDANGEVITPPLVGNGYVLVRTVDGRITAFDAQTGEQKWVYRNRAVPLNLRATSGMIFAGNAAVLAGFPGGTLAAINLLTGDAYWQTPVSYPQGVTEVERVNDVAGAPTLIGAQTCAVTFQGRIACLDANSGKVIWEQSFSSYGGLAQDDSAVASADDWSVLSLYDAASGRRLWQNTQLKSRDVSAPAIVGGAVVVGDFQGYVHFLSRDNGAFVARVKTGAPITAQPVLAGNVLVVQNRAGKLYGFRPQ